jgi:Zn finger protein HypA/HybF involved in hydrogenase expression
MTDCALKHTRYQPTEEEWRCPKCGRDSSAFYIEESENMDCDLLHPDDSIICDTCDKVWSGAAIARIFQNKAHRIICPTCKGTGYVEPE